MTLEEKAQKSKDHRLQGSFEPDSNIVCHLFNGPEADYGGRSTTNNNNNNNNNNDNNNSLRSAPSLAAAAQLSPGPSSRSRTLSSADRSPRQHQMVKYISSQKELLDNLTLLRGFQDGLKQLVSADELFNLFANLPEMQEVHFEYLRLLEDVQRTDEQFEGPLTDTLLRALIAISNASLRYCHATQHVQDYIEQLQGNYPSFGHKLIALRRDLGAGPDFINLIKWPLRQLGRYPQMIRELHSATPASHPDRNTLTSVAIKYDGLLKAANEPQPKPMSSFAAPRPPPISTAYASAATAASADSVIHSDTISISGISIGAARMDLG